MRLYLRHVLILALIHHVLIWCLAFELIAMAAGSVKGRPKGIEDQVLPRFLMLLAQPGGAFDAAFGITRRFGDSGGYPVTVVTSVLWGALLAIPMSRRRGHPHTPIKSNRRL